MKISFFKAFPILAFLLFSVGAKAQEQAPLLTGKVTVSIQEGTFDCDLTLSDIPRIKNYYIRLNSGMNILNLRSKKPNDFLANYTKSLADSLSTGESSAYYIPDETRKGKVLPEAIQFKYVGKFPVVKDTLNNNYSAEDWKGNIAFNGYSLRTDGAQSAWYPILYDIEKDKKYASVRYNIEVICKDCNALHLNGSKPFEGTQQTFRSDLPLELAMFLGNFKVANVNGTYILNPDLTTQQTQEFGKLTNSFKKYYERNLNIPYNQDITYIQTTPVSKNNAWLFVSYPSIMNIGFGEFGFKGMFDAKKASMLKPFLAHELGHYYFGFYKKFNTGLGDMMAEAFSEYLAIKASKEVLGEAAYQAKLEQKLKNVKGFEAIPFARIRTTADYKSREKYVYNYAPLMLLAIEKEIGAKKMWQWLNTLLQTPTDFTNYDFLTSTLRTTLKNDKKAEAISAKYFNSDNSLETAIRALGKI